MFWAIFYVEDRKWGDVPREFRDGERATRRCLRTYDRVGRIATRRGHTPHIRRRGHSLWHGAPSTGGKSASEP